MKNRNKQRRPQFAPLTPKEAMQARSASNARTAPKALLPMGFSSAFRIGLTTESPNLRHAQLADKKFGGRIKRFLARNGSETRHATFTTVTDESVTLQLGTIPRPLLDNVEARQVSMTAVHVQNFRWALVDTVAKSQAFPDTFMIPSEQERTSLCVGDMAKLCFEYEEYDEETPYDGVRAGGERMWVEVTAVQEGVGNAGPTYSGKLRSRPFWCDLLQFGECVQFDPIHIADILELAENGGQSVRNE